MGVVQPPRRCPHHVVRGLGYVDAAEDAEQRMARGERQVQCPTCRLWFWPDELGVAP